MCYILCILRHLCTSLKRNSSLTIWEEIFSLVFYVCTCACVCGLSFNLCRVTMKIRKMNTWCVCACMCVHHLLYQIKICNLLIWNIYLCLCIMYWAKFSPYYHLVIVQFFYVITKLKFTKVINITYPYNENPHLKPISFLYKTLYWCCIHVINNQIIKGYHDQQSQPQYHLTSQPKPLVSEILLQAWSQKWNKVFLKREVCGCRCIDWISLFCSIHEIDYGF